MDLEGSVSIRISQSLVYSCLVQLIWVSMNDFNRTTYHRIVYKNL